MRSRNGLMRVCQRRAQSGDETATTEWSAVRKMATRYGRGPARSGVAVAQQFSRQRAAAIDLVDTVAADNRTVDDHGVDSGGVRDQPIGTGGEIVDALERSRGDGCGIEDHRVAAEARSEPAAIADAEDFRRSRREHPD